LSGAVRHQGAPFTSPGSSGLTLTALAKRCQLGEDLAVSRVGRLALGLATALVGALAVALAAGLRQHPDEALAGGGAADWLQLLTGVALWLAGLELALRRSLRTPGWLVAATGPAVLAGALPAPGSGSAVIFTVGLAGGLTAPGLAGAAALAHPAPERPWPDAALGSVAVGAGLLVAGILPALVFDPRATGCFECPPNLLLVHADAALADTLLRDGVVASAVVCGGVAGLALLRLLRRPPLVRAAAAPVVAPLVLATAIGAAMFAHDASASEPLRDDLNRLLWLAFCVALLLAVAGVVAEIVRTRRLHGRIAGIVLEILPEPEALRQELAAALGDPRLRLAFPLSDGRTVDAGGAPLEPPAPDVAVTQVRGRGEVVAELRHASALAQAGDRVRSAARAAAPALEHAALQARLRAELRALDASRARVIEAADRERRRLERDLHDGAQQRLIALTVALHGEPAHAELLTALEELRDIAHGIHPVALSEAGLDAAIRNVAEASRVPLQVLAVPSGRLPAPVEAAAHRLVADAVECAARDGDGGAVQVSIAREGGLLRTHVRLPGVAPERAAARLEHCVDRFAALGGRLEAGPDDTIEGLVPCES
jgi:signal transduction histidine kinase